MNCQQVQVELSLYLYGELEFAREEELEFHLSGCALCQLALGREKAWHSSLNSERSDVPLDLLAQCRRDLRVALKADEGRPTLSKVTGAIKWRSLVPFQISANRWSSRIAFASLFLFLGFSLSRWGTSLGHLNQFGFGSAMESGLMGPATSRVRTVVPDDGNRVRIIVDRIQQQELVGNVNDGNIRQLLLEASHDPGDPGLRVDSVELLKEQNGPEIRDTLLYSVRHDENAAVRLKALEGLRHFSGDQETRDALRLVLEEDADPAVRTEAIDVLVPANASAAVSPELAITLRRVIEGETSDDYLRARCVQILRSVRQPNVY